MPMYGGKDWLVESDSERRLVRNLQLFSEASAKSSFKEFDQIVI